MISNVIQRAILTVAVIGVSFAANAANADEYGYGGYGGRYAASCDSDYDYDYVRCEYRWVTKYVIKTIPVRKRVVRYHSCGTPYYVWKTFYKEIEVPVRYRVKICR